MPPFVVSEVVDDDSCYAPTETAPIIVSTHAPQTFMIAARFIVEDPFEYHALIAGRSEPCLEPTQVPGLDDLRQNAITQERDHQPRNERRRKVRQAYG